MGADALKNFNPSFPEIDTKEEALAKVDWSLPGMEKISEDNKKFLTKLILEEDLVNSVHCLGWAFWPTKNNGYLDERLLRLLADFIEIQNKRFWDEYDKYCQEHAEEMSEEMSEEVEMFDVLS